MRNKITEILILCYFTKNAKIRKGNTLNYKKTSYEIKKKKKKKGTGFKNEARKA